MQFKQEIPEEQSRCPVNRFGAKRPATPTGRDKAIRDFVDAAITKGAIDILGLKPTEGESAEYRAGFSAGLRAAALVLRFQRECDEEKAEDGK